MRDVVIRRWCEFCWQDGATLTEATGSFLLSVAVGESSSLPPAKLIDVCDIHGKALVDLAICYEQAADEIPSTKVRQTVKARAGIADSRSAAQRQFRKEAAELSCPVCGRLYSARNHLITHIKKTHNSRYDPSADIDPDSPCPECGYDDFVSAQGLRMHMTRMHDRDAMVLTLAGVPGWNRLKAERWAKGLPIE